MTGPALAELQRWMKSRILPGAELREGDSVTFHPQAGEPGRERLAVYAEGYLARVQEGLLEVYPAVRHVLGPDGFWNLAVGYAGAFPSREYNLSFVGRHLERYLRGSAEEKRLPFLPDLAALEWNLCEAFHADDAPKADPAVFTGLTPDAAAALRLRFQPALRLSVSAWPVYDIWQARGRPEGEVDIVLDGRPQRTIAYRAPQVVCQLVGPEEASMLGWLLAGRTLGEACAELAESAPETESPVGEWLAGWIQKGIVTGAAA